MTTELKETCMSRRNPNESQHLITAEDAAWRLLEEANLENFRSGGHRGLQPVRDEPGMQYRAADVDAFIERNLRAA